MKPGYQQIFEAFWLCETKKNKNHPQKETNKNLPIWANIGKENVFPLAVIKYKSSMKMKAKTSGWIKD